MSRVCSVIKIKLLMHALTVICTRIFANQVTKLMYETINKYHNTSSEMVVDKEGIRLVWVILNFLKLVVL